MCVFVPTMMSKAAVHEHEMLDLYLTLLFLLILIYERDDKFAAF